jgi:endonuclease YncB( thermonuclease family)
MLKTQRSRCTLSIVTWPLFTVAGCTVTGESYTPPPLPTGGDAAFRLKDPVTVLRVVDGDTIDVDFHGVEESVRFKGIDTPELYSDPPEPFAQQARDFALTHIGTEVDIEFDSHCPQPPEELCRDNTSSHRLLAYVRVADGTDLGARQLAQGLAEVYIFQNEVFDRKAEYLAIEAEAKANHVGQWQ